MLRANQVWAPCPDNDPDAARAFMRRFYALVDAVHRLPLDPVKAARLDPTDARVAKERGLLVRSYT